MPERERDGEEAGPSPFLRGVAPAGAGAPAESPRAVLLRRFFLLVLSLAVLWVVVMLVGGDAGALAVVRARGRLEELEQRARALEAENARLRAEIRRLQADDRVIERLAREELKMARPDEEVILVPDPRTVPSPAPAPVR